MVVEIPIFVFISSFSFFMVDHLFEAIKYKGVDELKWTFLFWNCNCLFRKSDSFNSWWSFIDFIFFYILAIFHWINSKEYDDEFVFSIDGLLLSSGAIAWIGGESGISTLWEIISFELLSVGKSSAKQTRQT